MFNKIIVFIAVAFAYSSLSMALDENHYDEQYKQNVVPLLRSMHDGFFSGEKKVQIHYKTLLQANARNCLVIFPGRSEAIEKYAEVVYDLAQTTAGKNLNFYLMDHRGQGSSGRMVSPDDLGYVDQFHNYVLDVESFIKDQKLEKNCEKVFLLAHSLGAGISTAYILLHPKFFNKVALISPMLKILTKPYTYKVARAIVQASTMIGRGAKFAVGQKRFNPDDKFEGNTVTSSLARFKMSRSIFVTYPASKLGGVSNRFVLEVMKGTNLIRSRYHEISAPLRVFHAGLEYFSEPSEMIKICDEAINCERSLFTTSKHELLMERDEIRSEVIKSLGEFFN